MNDSSFDIEKLPELIKNIKELVGLLPSTKNKLYIVEYILFESNIPEEHIPQAFEYVLDNSFFQARKVLSEGARRAIYRAIGVCENCGSLNIYKNGLREGKQRYVCRDCKHQYTR